MENTILLFESYTGDDGNRERFKIDFNSYADACKAADAIVMSLKLMGNDMTRHSAIQGRVSFEGGFGDMFNSFSIVVGDPIKLQSFKPDKYPILHYSQL